ncbi:MAG: hypothetical protein IKS52_04670 [Clostridia bacterium]|nr:hypothetical protein [Clostridia bacterium]
MKKNELPFDVEIPKDLWGRVRLACAVRGKKLSQLSLEVGYNQKQAVVNISAQESVPRGDKVARIAMALDVPWEWLMEGAAATRGIRAQMLKAKREARKAARHG